MEDFTGLVADLFLPRQPHNTAMKKTILLLLLLGLNACGQTGPLYHPDDKAPIHVEKEES